MRYTLKFDHQPRIKVDPKGYRSVSEAMGRADRAVLSGKCTAAEVLSADGKVLHSTSRENVAATLSTWTKDQIRYWKAG